MLMRTIEVAMNAVLYELNGINSMSTTLVDKWLVPDQTFCFDMRFGSVLCDYARQAPAMGYGYAKAEYQVLNRVLFVGPTIYSLIAMHTATIKLHIYVPSILLYCRSLKSSHGYSATLH